MKICTLAKHWIRQQQKCPANQEHRRRSASPATASIDPWLWPFSLSADRNHGKWRISEGRNMSTLLWKKLSRIFLSRELYGGEKTPSIAIKWRLIKWNLTPWAYFRASASVGSDKYLCIIFWLTALLFRVCMKPPIPIEYMECRISKSNRVLWDVKTSKINSNIFHKSKHCLR